MPICTYARVPKPRTLYNLAILIDVKLVESAFEPAFVRRSTMLEDRITIDAQKSYGQGPCLIN